MSNSEIDVSKCIHYHDGGCGNDNTMFECCSKNNCIYKQLQQLKTENELLKNERTIDLRNQLEQLKESNKTLNKMLLILNNRLEEYKRIYGEL